MRAHVRAHTLTHTRKGHKTHTHVTQTPRLLVAEPKQALHVMASVLQVLQPLPAGAHSILGGAAEVHRDVGANASCGAWQPQALPMQGVWQGRTAGKCAPAKYLPVMHRPSIDAHVPSPLQVAM